MKIPYSRRRGKGGIFVYRRRVPNDLQAVVGVEFWKISLKTSSPSEAMLKAVALASEHNELIVRHKRLSPVARVKMAFDATVARHSSQRSALRDDLRSQIQPGADPTPQVTIMARVMEMQNRTVAQIAEKLLAEAAKLVVGLPEQDRTVIEATGGLKNLADYTRGADIFNSLLREHLAEGDELDGTLVASDELKRREERERELEALKVEARQLRSKKKVLAKVGLIDEDDGPEDPTNPRVQTVLEKWLAHQNQGDAAKQRHRVAIRRFVEVFGNIPVREITRAQVLAYRDHCEKIPDTRRLRFEKRSQAISDLGAKRLPTISSVTVERHLITIKALLKWCISNVADFGSVNVASGIVAAKDTRKQRDIVRSFTSGEMKLIFEKVGEHYDDTRGRDRRRKEDMNWLVWTACYSGCRLEELCQLARDNVRQVGDVWVLDINERDGRKLKNEFSERLVPIHPVLVERGFVRWVRSRDTRRVFASFELRTNVSGKSYGNAASSSFARFLDRIGLTDKTLKFHSFRHAFIEAMRNAQTPYSVELALVGHSDKLNPAHGGYGGGARVDVLAKWIARIDPMGAASVAGLSER